MIMVALVRSWQDLAKILASIPMHLGKRAKIRITGLVLIDIHNSICIHSPNLVAVSAKFSDPPPERQLLGNPWTVVTPTELSGQQQ